MGGFSIEAAQNGAIEQFNETMRMAQQARDSVGANPNRFATEYAQRQTPNPDSWRGGKGDPRVNQDVADAIRRNEGNERKEFPGFSKDVADALGNVGVAIEWKSIVLPSGKPLTPDANTTNVSVENVMVAKTPDGPADVTLRVDNAQGSPQYLTFSRGREGLRVFFSKDGNMLEIQGVRHPADGNPDWYKGGKGDPRVNQDVADPIRRNVAATERKDFVEFSKDVADSLKAVGVSVEWRSIKFPNGDKLPASKNTLNISVDNLQVAKTPDGPGNIVLRVDNKDGTTGFLDIRKNRQGQHEVLYTKNGNTQKLYPVQ